MRQTTARTRPRPGKPLIILLSRKGVGSLSSSASFPTLLLLSHYLILLRQLAVPSPRRPLAPSLCQVCLCSQQYRSSLLNLSYHRQCLTLRVAPSPSWPLVSPFAHVVARGVLPSGQYAASNELLSSKSGRFVPARTHHNWGVTGHNSTHR